MTSSEESSVGQDAGVEPAKCDVCGAKWDMASFTCCPHCRRSSHWLGPGPEGGLEMRRSPEEMFDDE